MKNRQNKTLSSYERLSPREKECLHWISQGKTMEETAMILGIKYGTVVGYVCTLKRLASASTGGKIKKLSGVLFRTKKNDSRTFTRFKKTSFKKLMKEAQWK